MNSVKGITKYYIGFALLMIFGIGMLAYAFSQAGAAKTDRQTNKTIEQISIKLESKIATDGRVPNSLQEAGITNPAPAVTYQKISDQKYKICINYKSASSGFDAGWFSLLGGGFYGGGSDNFASQDHSYFDSSVEFYHKKGPNCQTVNTNSYGSCLDFCGSPPVSTSGNRCTDYAADFKVSGDVTVSSVDTAKKIIYFEPSGQYVFDYTTAAGSSVPTISSKLYDDNTIFCDGQTLKNTTVSALKTGDQVVIYLKSSSDATLSEVSTTYQFGN